MTSVQFGRLMPPPTCIIPYSSRNGSRFFRSEIHSLFGKASCLSSASRLSSDSSCFRDKILHFFLKTCALSSSYDGHFADRDSSTVTGVWRALLTSCQWDGRLSLASIFPFCVNAALVLLGDACTTRLLAWNKSEKYLMQSENDTLEADTVAMYLVSGAVDGCHVVSCLSKFRLNVIAAAVCSP